MDQYLKSLDDPLKSVGNLSGNLIWIRDYLSKNDFVWNCLRK